MNQHPRVHVTDVGDMGPKALFLHCGLASHAALFALVGALPPMRVRMMDLLGHGQSQRADGPSQLADNARAAVQVFDGPGVVFGHSFGGVIALRLALDHPNRVRALVLYEPVLHAAAKGTATFDAYLRATAQMADGFATNDLEAASIAFMGQWGDSTPWDRLSAPARTYITDRIYIIRDTQEDLLEDKTELLAPGLIEGIQCPVLLLRGSEGPEITKEINATLLKRLPNASETVIHGVGHMGPVKNPKRVAEAMAHFIT